MVAVQAKNACDIYLRLGDHSMVAQVSRGTGIVLA